MFSVYIPRDNGIEVFESKLNQIAQRYPDANILLAGDFNARCEENQDITLNDEIDFIFKMKQCMS